MKKITIVSLVASFVACAAGAALVPGDPPDKPAASGTPVVTDTEFHMPRPTREHTWLEQGIGEWDALSTISNPGGDPFEAKGIERVRAVGDFWIVNEGEATVSGMPFSSVLTLGFDPEKKKFIGTWIDSFSSYMWHYVGSLDADGKVLTLETEGPGMGDVSKHTKFRETTEYKSPDHRVFTSSMLGEDGAWTTIVTVESRRRKS